MTEKEENPLEEVARACMDDSMTEEEEETAEWILSEKEGEWKDIVDAISDETELSPEDMEEMLGEESVTEVIVCENCGNIIPVDAEKCPYCGAPLHIDIDPWSLYKQMIPDISGEKELIFTYSDYSSGKYIFLERITSSIYEKYRLIEMRFYKGMKTPLIEIYEDMKNKWGE